MNKYCFVILRSSRIILKTVNKLIINIPRTASLNPPNSSTKTESSHENVEMINNPTVNSVVNYLKCNCNAKEILKEASRLFVEKPAKAFNYLISIGATSTPVNPAFIARFLRSLHNLKVEVGEFIGELGKKEHVEVWDSVEFREQIRQEYANTFHFNGQSILDCFRIFLSAFRLPGEAQQIDRILVAFSEICYAITKN